MTTGSNVLRRVTTPHATLPWPDALREETYEGADAVLTYAGDAPGFRPNLVVTSVESDAPLTDAALTAALAPYQQHAGARVLSVDAWDLDDDGVPRARRIVFAYRADDARDVLVHKWVWATGRAHVHLSASFLPSQARVFARLFAAIASDVELVADAEAVRAAARATGAATVHPDLSARTGFPLEDLSAVPSPRFLAQGAVVPLGALQTLLTGAGRTRLGAARGVLPRTERDTDAARLLAASGWTDTRGHLTDLGGDIADVLRSERHIATLRLRRGDRTEALTAYAGADAGLIVCSASPQEPGLPDPDSRHVALVPAEHVPAILAAWADVRPFWSFSEPDEQLSTAELESHVSASDLDPVEPWTEVLIRTPHGERVDVLSPSRGFLQVGPPSDGRHAITGDPSGAVFDVLLDACDRAFTGRA